MCEYCEPTTKYKIWNEEEYKYTKEIVATKAICNPFPNDEDAFVNSEIWIMEGNLLCGDNSGNEYNKASARINFCPMCGRKLTAESK